MYLDIYKEKFSNLNLHKSNFLISPHKIYMLLATIDLIQVKYIVVNEIYYDEMLIIFYKNYLDLNNKKFNIEVRPYYPFFHLSKKLKNNSQSFWHLSPKSNSDVDLCTIDSIRSTKELKNCIKYAYLDNELFELIKNHKNAIILKKILNNYLI